MADKHDLRTPNTSSPALEREGALRLFAEGAVKIGVPAERAGKAAQQLFNSMVRNYATIRRQSNRDLRRCGLAGYPRMNSELALLQWLGNLPTNTRLVVIMNNVRPYVPLYQDDGPQEALGNADRDPSVEDAPRGPV